MARGHSMPRGFVSKKQWGKFFATPRLRKYARKEAHKTPGGPKLRYRRLPVYVNGVPTSWRTMPE